MRSRNYLFLIAVTTVLAMVATQASADMWQTVYQTDFSSDPRWTTNDPSNLAWDSATGTFPCAIGCDAVQSALRCSPGQGKGARLSGCVHRIILSPRAARSDPPCSETQPT